MKKYNVCFIASGTLGHIVPAFSIINNSDNEFNYYLISGIRPTEVNYIKHKIDENVRFEHLGVDVEGFNRKCFFLNSKNLNNLKKVKEAQKQIRGFYVRNNIECVVGIGGFISYIAIKEAKKLKIKTIIIEENACYGLANLLLRNKVDRVYSYFDIGDKYSKCIGSFRFSEVRNNYLNKMNRTKGKRLLVLGGSNGSEVLNDEFIKLKEYYIENSIKATIVTGSRYYNKNRYLIKNSICDNLRILEFSYDLLDLINESDIIVSRSGASTISEILALKKVAILVPSPNVTRNHQEKNARKISSKNLALFVEEGLLNSSYIKKLLNDSFNKNKTMLKIKEHVEKYTTVDVITIFKKEVKDLINGL